LESVEDSSLNSYKDDMIKEYMRKNFIKFYINIYKDNAPLSSNSKMGVPGVSQASSSVGGVTPHGNQVSISGMSSTNLEDLSGVGTKYMLDIHLFKGTVYVFMDFVRKFMHVITASCSLCITNSGCDSSAHSSTLDAMSNQGHQPHVHHDYKLKLLM